MIEEVLLNYLIGNIPALHFGMERKDDTDIVIQVEPGGNVENFLHDTPFRIYSYGESMAICAERSEQIENALLQMQDEVLDVTSVNLNKSFFSRDSVTNEYRYVTPVTIYHY